MYSYSSGEAVKDTLHGVCGPIKQGDAGQVSLIAQEIKWRALYILDAKDEDYGQKDLPTSAFREWG